MKRILMAGLLGLAACDEAMLASGPGGESAFREFLVIGSSMSFEECRAVGGLIIRDANSPMTACDPSVRRDVVAEEDLLQGDDRAAAEAADVGT